MPTKGSCLKLTTSGSSVRTLKRMTSITLSKDQFLLFGCYTSAGLPWNKSSNFRSARQPGYKHWPFLRGPRTLNNGYYILKLKNTRWSFQWSIKTYMVGLIGLTGSSGLSNRWIRFVLYLLDQYLGQHMWCGRRLHWVAMIAYGLWINMSI